MIHKLHIVCLLAVIFFTAIGCQLRPLEDPSGLIEIKITVNTDNISNVTCDFYNPNITYPVISTDMVRCMFYDPDSGELISQSFITDKEINEKGQEVLSGNVNIFSGCFDIICYNFDAPNTLIADEGILCNSLAYTSESTKTDEKIYVTPDQLVVSRDLDYTIYPHDKLIVIETYALSCIDTYYIQIKVKNSKNFKSANAILTGMSPGNKFAINERLGESSSITFNMEPSVDEKKYGKEDNDVLCGVFNTFGKIDVAESVLYLKVTSTSGEIVEKVIAMDKVFATEDAKNHYWLLIDDVIEIPEDPVGGGGFSPGIDDWDEEEGEIIL